jgi:hypothetical protein
MILALYIIAVVLAFIAGCFNGLMDVCIGPFQNSRISHWNPKFWEVFGNGQAWSNKFVNRDVIARVRVHWIFVIKGKTYKINKPVEILDGWHMFKFGWRVFSVLPVIPIATVCHNEVGAVLMAALMYFPQWVGFYSTFYFLTKKP